tara:strand:+ start:301 stop:942 length:642 start_codon:yes stop_codon:yes gene_type:complete
MTNSVIQEVIALIDRSGSMRGKEDDTIGGINSTFEVLKKDKPDNTTIKVSIKLFDHEEQLLIRSLPLDQVINITRSQYVVRGQTALLDAIGTTLAYFMEKKLVDSDAYDSCLIYIVTDGLENSSKQYSNKKIKLMIANADENYNIKIIYLAANQDAILEAANYGIDSSRALNYSENSENVNAAYRAAAAVAVRSMTTGDAQFTQVERTASNVN